MKPEKKKIAGQLESGTGISVAAGSLIVLATVAAYAGGLNGPFVFDDPSSITDNPTIRHLWPIGPVLSPPYALGQTVGGRPLLNFSLALNYAVGGLSVWGYHATNVAIHILAALAFFGVVRRTLELPLARPWLGGTGPGRAIWVAGIAALLWAVHPLQTESVSYVIQRAESLMGLFYLFTLYAFIRWARGEEIDGGRHSPGWAAAALVSCVLGMATKEVMVTAPLIVFLYDRIFLAGSFREAWSKRGRVHAAFASTWLLLGFLAWAAHGRGGTVGAGVAVSWWDYELTQPAAILHYLRLVVWPHPLIFDYGAEWVKEPWSVLPGALLVAALIAGIVIALRRGTAAGFAGAWFLAILAPTSLFPGIRQTIAEHRMYVALAPVTALGVIGVAAWIAHRSPPQGIRRGLRAAAALAAAIAVAFVLVTRARNATYASDVALWSDTVARRPNNGYAHNDLGVAVRDTDIARAIVQFNEALRLIPDNPEVHNNLGAALEHTGHPVEAVAHYREAVRLRPNFAEAYNNLGVALADLGRPADSVEALDRALELKPDYGQASYNLGVSLAEEGRRADATEAYARAVRLDPSLAEARVNLGIAYARAGRIPEALEQFDAAVKIRPGFAEAHFNRGNALVMAERYNEAAREYEAALRLKPGFAPARENLERLRSQGVDAAGAP